ncbi:hypothetical protein JL720_10351 [Aureococcus anophagefferens]|nr:hypothetical protein JL720_10351 [Aureococcus anophagefferens]
MASFAPPGEPTPSMRDGYSASEEKKKRRQTSWYISECGLALKLPKLPVLTAQHYFQKFYQAESFKAHDRFHVAMACLFLAAKVEESPERLGKLVATCGAVRHPKAPPLDQQSEAFAATKHEVLVKERALLYAIGFDAPQKIASAMAFITIIYMRKLPPKSDKARLNRMFATLSISERSLNSICSEMVSLYTENARCQTLIRDLAHMGHLHPEVLRELGLAGPAPRARSPAPGELKRPRPP